MNDKKKVLSIADTQADAKRKEFNAALNTAIKLMPEGCGIIIIPSDQPTTYQLGNMLLTHVLGSLEMLKADLLRNPEGTRQ